MTPWMRVLCAIIVIAMVGAISFSIVAMIKGDLWLVARGLMCDIVAYELILLAGRLLQLQQMRQMVMTASNHSEGGSPCAR